MVLATGGRALDRRPGPSRRRLTSSSGEARILLSDLGRLLGLGAVDVRSRDNKRDQGGVVPGFTISTRPAPGPSSNTPTWYVYLNCASGAYPGDKLGVTRRIWYTSTDEHVYKTARQSTWRHPAIWPGGTS